MKKKKLIFGQKRFLGYCPNILKKKKFIAIQFLYCREGSLKGWRYCIVRTKFLYCKVEVVLQLKGLVG